MEYLRKECVVLGAHTPLDKALASAEGVAASEVRELARCGLLSERIAAAPAVERIRLRGGAYDIVWRVVFQRSTRRLERRRGHRTCATSVKRLEAECLDRFHDDVEAALEDLLRNASIPIANLDGWIASRLRQSTVDGYRRRRGTRGALQRPRLPRRLAKALGDDPWLTELAVEILVWVGIPATAGTGVWPLGAWAERRAAATGDHRAGEPEVMNDVETVLAAMRRSQKWYDDFVERPLGRKEASVVSLPRGDSDAVVDPQPLSVIEQHEVDDARLHRLAAAAVAGIEVGLRRGEPPRDAVKRVLSTVFGAGVTAEDMVRIPEATPGDDEHVLAMVADPARLDLVVEVVLGLIAGRELHRP